MDEGNLIIVTDNVLARLIQPYTNKEIQVLRERLSVKKDKQIIHVWNGRHLNDEYLYRLCCDLGVEIEIKNHDFSDFVLAAIYVCKNQLLRPELTNEYLRYVVGKEFNYSLGLETRNNPKTQASKTKVANIIGTRLFMASGTVIKYGSYAEAIDNIFDGHEQFAREILIGRIMVSHENIIELSRVKPEELKSVYKRIKNNKIEHLSFADIRDGVKERYLQEKGTLGRSEKRKTKKVENAGIRQMPVFDPDSEVNSLCMTIGSWISSIQRVNNSVDFNRITTKARLQLVKELSYLERTVNNIQESLIERKQS